MPEMVSIILLFTIVTCLSFALSNITKPAPPSAMANPADKPSMMYCPLILPPMNATCLSPPVLGSLSVPIEGGWLITTYTAPEMMRK
eukprot:CAMPEP_0114149048 /NCGR_PEP_ID=MMETSP0043_2-20121206/21949_1 /TAXON_ID=464988 /ORGANISM="Hemiselmis andersenii, Strain CCMP644" /LENGTH=86 /DNA_ID=CAMNT_0001243661 /DNA_START=195 /DNA_END=455 /DNA_ORIENTATION=+